MNFGWSPLIHAAFKANIHFFDNSTRSFFSFPGLPSLTPSVPFRPSPLKGLIALHIRRGDFASHCSHLANWSSDFNGFNSFDDLPDKFTVPPGGGSGENTPENTAIYIRRCYPSIAQIVQKVLAVKAERQRKGEAMNKVYIMTNGPLVWLAELKAALYAASPWDGVTTSRDLSLTWEQKYVAQALDMYIGQWAHVFIGNGVQSFVFFAK